MAKIVFYLFVFLFLFHVQARTVVYQGIPNDDSMPVKWKNGALFNATFPTLMPGDTFLIPNQVNLLFFST